MSEPKKRGRPPAPNPRQKINLYLTVEEVAELERQRGSTPQAVYARELFLRGLRSLRDPFTRAMAYHDSGQAARDEAAEIAEDMAELERQIAARNPPPLAGQPAEGKK